MNTSTDRKGISKEEYQQRQAQCEQEKFTVETNRRLQQLELSLLELQKGLNIQKAFNGSIQSSCESEISEMAMNMASSLKEFRQALGDMQGEMTAQNTKIRVIGEDQNFCLHPDDLKIELKPLKKVVDDLCDAQDKLHREVHGLIDRQKQEFINQLKSLKEELLSRPTGLPELQKLLEAKIELVELNGQNAVLRSSNNEKQLLLVERKIDNIYQLIKKLELAKE